MIATELLEPSLRRVELPPGRVPAASFPYPSAVQSVSGEEARGGVRCMNVILVEHQALFRFFLREFVNRLPGFTVVGEFASTAEAEEACAQLPVDLAIIDFLTWESSLTSLVSRLRQRNPRTATLILTGSIEAYHLEQAFAAGVSAVVDKNVGLDLLERAVKAVAAGRQFFSPEATLVWRELLRRKSDALSDRERDVLGHIARGRFSKEVAAEMGVSVFTVENIRRRIMKKTGLRSVAELALHAVRLGLVPPPRGELASRGAGR